MNPLRLTITALTLAGCVALSSLVCAEEWPAKPLRIVSPYAAGGVGDTLIRVIAPNLEARLGQRLILDNKPGAAGKIGVAEVVNARPDGYTYVIAPTANFAVNQHLFDNLGFDPLTQLDPVTTIAEAPLIAVVPTSGPASLREFAELARANPGKFNFGSPGSGSPAHLAGVYFSQLTGHSLQHVAYRGGPPLVLAMLAGEIQIAFPTLTTVSTQITAGKFKAIAVMSRARNSEFPGVPAAPEAGFPDLIFGNWWVLATTHGTDHRLISRLNADIISVLSDPVIRTRLAELGQTTLALGPDESGAFIKSESARYKTLIERNNIKLEQ